MVQINFLNRISFSFLSSSPENSQEQDMYCFDDQLSIQLVEIFDIEYPILSLDAFDQELIDLFSIEERLIIVMGIIVFLLILNLLVYRWSKIAL